MKRAIFLFGLLLILISCGGGGGGSSTPGDLTSGTNTSGSNTSSDTTSPVTTASPAGATFNAGFSVTLSASEAATIYYTKDGTTPAVNGATTLSAASPVTNIQIQPGPAVRLQYFAVDTAGNQETLKSQTYSIVPLTTANPPGSHYASAQSVTLTASEPATIYYTTNGTAPIAASAHGASPIPNIPVTGNTILKFFAIDAGNSQETIRTEVYTIP